MQKHQPQANSRYLDEFRIIGTLGSGTYAQVKHAILDGDGTQYAIKKYKKQNADPIMITNQFNNIKRLDNPNIMRAYQIRDNAQYTRQSGKKYNCFAIILEYQRSHDLNRYLRQKMSFSENVVRTYFIMILDALQHMHNRGVVHRDMKLSNIALSQDFSLKIVDFGFSKLVMNDEILYQPLGTEGYKAPEIYQQKYNGKVVDIFAVGVIIFKLMTNVSPFLTTSQRDIQYSLIKQKKFDKFWPKFQNEHPVLLLKNDFKNLMERMFAYKPQQRLSITEIRNHQWTNGKTVTLNQIKQQFICKRKQIDQQNQLKRELNREKNQHMFDPPSSDMRSTSQFQDYYDILNQTDQFNLKQTIPNPIDMVLDIKPNVFYALLHKFFKDKGDQNLIANQNQKQYFDINFDNTKVQINITLDYSVNCQDEQLSIIIRLFKNHDGKLRVRCLINEGDDMSSYKLIGLIQNQFAYLESK